MVRQPAAQVFAGGQHESGCDDLGFAHDDGHRARIFKVFSNRAPAGDVDARGRHRPVERLLQPPSGNGRRGGQGLFHLEASSTQMADNGAHALDPEHGRQDCGANAGRGKRVRQNRRGALDLRSQRRRAPSGGGRSGQLDRMRAHGRVRIPQMRENLSVEVRQAGNTDDGVSGTGRTVRSAREIGAYSVTALVKQRIGGGDEREARAFQPGAQFCTRGPEPGAAAQRGCARCGAHEADARPARACGEGRTDPRNTVSNDSYIKGQCHARGLLSHSMGHFATELITKTQ